MPSPFRILSFLTLCILTVSVADASYAAATVEELEALIASNHEAHQQSLNHMWTMIAAALVFFMQGGFLLLEAGMSRSKNSINVAQKNIVDFIIAVVAFYALGFAVMFGATQGGWFGWDSSLAFMSQSDDWNYTFFIFQAVFAGTAGTIVSGAIAERTSFAGYVVVTVLIAALIYPIIGHWAWGNLLNGDNTSYLMDGGFIDFAGSTVVHSVGAWVALAACLVVGPRIGRFCKDGKPQRMDGHSLVLSTLGCIILWVGWIGFNGGSTTTGDSSFAHIIYNTMIAAVFGGAVAMLIGRIVDGYFSPDQSINGILGGLVAITAGCDAVTGTGAAIIGASAGAVMFMASMFLLRVCKVDDVVGAIPVHGFCGAWGTILLALVMPEENLAAASRMAQFSIQAQGVLITFAYAFGVAFAGCYIINKFIGLRVSEEHELEGLNSSEHNATLGTGVLQQRLREVVEGDRDLTKRIVIEAGDEAGEVAAYVNTFLSQMQELMTTIHGEAQNLAERSDSITDISTIMASSSEEMSAQSLTVANFNSEVAEDIGEISGSAESMSEAVNRISDSANEMTGSMQQVSEIIASLRDSISDVAGKSRNADEVTRRAQQLSGVASQTVLSLNEATKHISDVVGVIRGIAEQTNMLALNATIEASRAGEAGKGFSVVADEVKSLAEETSKATADIRDRIEKMQANSNDVSAGIEQVAEILNSVTEAVSNISLLTEEQDSNADEISRRFAETSQGAGLITEQIAAIAHSAGGVSEKARRTSSNANEIQRNMTAFNQEAGNASGTAQKTHALSGEIKSVSQRLNEAVSKYKI